MARIIAAQGRQRTVIRLGGVASYVVPQVVSRLRPAMAMGPMGLTYTVAHYGL